MKHYAYLMLRIFTVRFFVHLRNFLLEPFADSGRHVPARSLRHKGTPCMFEKVLLQEVEVFAKLPIEVLKHSQRKHSELTVTLTPEAASYSSTSLSV